jgi:hypothetical protein
MSNDSGDADGTIGSRVALDEFEVDHLCRSRDPDLGREAAEGIGSCPNGMPDPDCTARVLGLDEGERPVIVLTFGFSVGAREPQRRSPEEWIVPADRRPFEEVVRRL